MDNQFVGWIAEHGSLALFGLLALGIAGLPVPGETLLVISGILIEQHKLSAVPTYLAAMAGSAVGITISYYIGRGMGVTVIRRYGRRLHIESEDLEDVRVAFRRAGKWGLMFGYFVPGIRHLTALVAGAASLEFGLFSMFAYVGACLWCAAFITLGRYVGDRWEAIASKLTLPGWAITALAIAAVVTFVVIRRRRRAHTS